MILFDAGRIREKLGIRNDIKLELYMAKHNVTL